MKDLPNVFKLIHKIYDNFNRNRVSTRRVRESGAHRRSVLRDGYDTTEGNL